MDRKMIVVVIVVSALSGFLGGIFANSLWKPAYSETQKLKIIKADIIKADVVYTRSVVIRDSKGIIRMSLDNVGEMSYLSIFDAKGNPKLSLGTVSRRKLLSGLL